MDDISLSMRYKAGEVREVARSMLVSVLSNWEDGGSIS